MLTGSLSLSGGAELQGLGGFAAPFYGLLGGTAAESLLAANGRWQHHHAVAAAAAAANNHHHHHHATGECSENLQGALFWTKFIKIIDNIVVLDK